MLLPLLLLLLATDAFSADGQSATLVRKGLDKYPLAVCNDGSKAAYYHQQSSGNNRQIMIYLPDDASGSCQRAAECTKKCEKHSDSCSAKTERTLRMNEGIWSSDRRNNPFASHFKILLPSCSSDEFSGTRGKSSSTGGLFFHGRHVFSSLLRDLVSNFNLAKAREIVLVGSGSGARGAARNCDFLADSIATVNRAAKVRCVLDGADFVPYWITSPRCDAEHHEAEKFLWGRADDETCLKATADSVNSTELARKCGVFSMYWKHVQTPVFVTATQLDPGYFGRATCGVSAARDDDYSDYAIGWRQGMLVLAESMSLEKPSNGWFIPNCDDVPHWLGGEHAKERRGVTVALLQEEEQKVNAMQAINNWLKKGNKHQAIDAYGVPNEKCSARKSLPLDLRPDAFFPDLEDAPGVPVRHTVNAKAARHRPPPPAAVTDSSLTPAHNPFITSRAFGRFHPPAELIVGSRQRLASSGAFVPDGFFDYDGLGLGGSTNYDFDFASDSGIATGVADTVGPPSVYNGGGVARPSYGHRQPTVVVSSPSVPTATTTVRRVHHVQKGVAAAPPRRTVVAGSVVHSPYARVRLWRKLYYLNYLRAVYARHYNDYYRDFYGSGRQVVHLTHSAAPAAAVTDHHDVVTTTHHDSLRQPFIASGAHDDHHVGRFGSVAAAAAAAAVPHAHGHTLAIGLARIQERRTSKNEGEAVAKARGEDDDEYEFPDEQFEELEL